MIDLGAQWGLLTIIGPIVLAVAILWAIFHNRSSRSEVDRSERATHRLYDEENRRDTMHENR